MAVLDYFLINHRFWSSLKDMLWPLSCPWQIAASTTAGKKESNFTAEAGLNAAQQLCDQGLVVQQITKLTVRMILWILSHGSDNFSDQQKTTNKKKFAFHLLLKVYFKYFYTTARTTSWTNKVSNKTRTITQITSVDKYNIKLLIKSLTLVFRCRNVIINCKITQ